MKRTIKVVRAKRLASAWQLKCQAVLVGSSNSTHTTTGCLVGSVWGNQHLCMQRQSFLASNVYAGQHPKPQHWVPTTGIPTLPQASQQKSLDSQKEFTRSE